ncbi:hypothetical protein CXF87_14730 [Halomonas sp. MES3-P3E]|nr:hypothetical protein CXF87_14730 [Halomonas sp. MES3-P3E]
METAALPIELLACIVICINALKYAYTTAGAMVADKIAPDNPFFILRPCKSSPEHRDKKSEQRSLFSQLASCFLLLTKYGAHGRN